MSDSLLLPAKERLLRFINVYNIPYDILITEITLGTPAVLTGDRNTRLRIDAVPTSRFEAHRTILYNRLSLAEVFDNGFSLTITEEPEHTRDLLPLILAQFDINLAVEDIVDEVIPSGTTTYTLKAHANSYGWVGEVDVVIGVEEQSDYFLLDNHQLFLLDDGSYLILD